MKKVYSFLIVLFFAFILVGCGEKITVTIDGEAEISIEEGQSQKVTATVSDLEAAVEWKSSDESVATVSDGTISAIKPGQATITVSVKNAKDATASIVVTVTEKIIYEVKVDNKDITMIEGKELTITPTYTKNTTLEWENSDNSIITVVDGKVTALKEGTASIKISIVDHPEAYARVNVTVLKKITVNKTEVAIDKGTDTTVEATGAEGMALVWASSDESIATVEDGKITGIKPGNAVVSVMMEGYEESKVEIAVTVNKVLAESVTINFTNNKLTVGEKEQLSATVAPEAADQLVDWIVTNNNVVSISPTGEITALAVGTATIKAVVRDGSEKYYEYEVTVYNAVADFEIAGNNTMKANETQTLALTIKTENTMEKFSWSSSDEAIATVDQNGLVTALDEGTVTIKVVAQDAGKFEKSFEITISKDKIKIGTTEYKTLAEALAAAVAGDTIEIPGGIYSESVTIDKNNITFKGPNAGIKGDETRGAEAEFSGIITVASNVEGFKFDGFKVTEGFQVALSEGSSKVTFQYNVMEGTTKDGIVRGPAEGTVTNIVMNYNYSASFGSYRFGHFASTIDGLEMKGNNITCGSGPYDFVNVQGLIKGKVVIEDNTYINSQQSFFYALTVGVMECTIKGNYVENVASTVIDFRDMKEDGAVKFLIENNEFKNAGCGWDVIRIRTASYDANDSISIEVKDNKFIDSYTTTDDGTPVFVFNPTFEKQSEPFKAIYTIGKNYYEIGGAAYTDLKSACFGEAAISFEAAYATSEEVPGF